MYRPCQIMPPGDNAFCSIEHTMTPRVTCFPAQHCSMLTGFPKVMVDAQIVGPKRRCRSLHAERKNGRGCHFPKKRFPCFAQEDL